MHKLNQSQIKSAFATARMCKARAVMIYVDPLEDLKYTDPIPKKTDLYLVSRKKGWDVDPEESISLVSRAKAFITLPKTPMSRTSVMKVATSIALASDYIADGETVVFLVGLPELGRLDHLQILNTREETELVTSKGIAKIGETVQPEVFQAILNLSVELADKGREGKPIGTIFVVGDEEKVLQFSKQMIINPFKGYDEEERNILTGGLKETIREFAAMDGAFVISGDGVVLTAGRYLSSAMDDAKLPRGLGSRHIAAAGITTLTNAIAFVISESSGDLRVFKDGKIVMTIEKAPSKK